MSNDGKPAKVLDWPALMAEAKRVVEEKAKLKLLTTKELEDALNLLRVAAMQHVLQNHDKPEAAEAARDVALAVQSLFFVLNALHGLARGLQVIQVEDDVRRLILAGRVLPGEPPPSLQELKDEERTSVAQQARMSLPFHRALAALREWNWFALKTGLLPQDATINLLGALNDLAEGEHVPMLRHPNAKKGAPGSTLHVMLQCFAVTAVEAFMRAETLGAVEAGKINPGQHLPAVRKAACNGLATVFDGYRTPSGKPVTPEMIEDWHDKWAHLLRAEDFEKAAAKAKLPAGFKSLWEGERARLRGLGDNGLKPGETEADRLERMGSALCQVIRNEIERGFVPKKPKKPRETPPA